MIASSQPGDLIFFLPVERFLDVDSSSVDLELLPDHGFVPVVASESLNVFGVIGFLGLKG